MRSLLAKLHAKVPPLLFAASTEFVRAFLAVAIVYIGGILTAPNYDAALALSVAALTAALAAGLRAIQVFIPAISLRGLIGPVFGAWADAFLRVFLATAVTALTGWLAAPDWSTWKSSLLGIVAGAAAAGMRALQGVTNPEEQPTIHRGGT